MRGWFGLWEFGLPFWYSFNILACINVAIVGVKNHEEDTFQYVDVDSRSKGEDLMWVLS